METTINAARVWRHWKESKRIGAVAVYEDSSTRTRVEEFCRALARDLGQNCQLATEMWPLSELRMTRLRSIAAGEAARADLIIISVHHAEAFPDEVTGWMETWGKARPRHHAVLMALFDPVYAGPSGALQEYLQKIADEGGLDFIVQTDEKPEEH